MKNGGKFAGLLAVGAAVTGWACLGAVNPLPDDYADIIGTAVPILFRSSNVKQDIVGTWLTRNGHAWVMLKVLSDEYNHGYTVDVSLDGTFCTNLSFKADYRQPSELKPLPGLDLDVGSGKPCYYYPLDVTGGNGVEFGKPVEVFLDCVEVGGGHDVRGTATPVIPDDCTLLTVTCRYGDRDSVVEKMLVEIAPETQDEWPRGIDRPAGSWVLERATVNGEAASPFTDGEGHRNVVRFSPARGTVTEIVYDFAQVARAVSLWITDHNDAGDGRINLAFKPTLERDAPVTADWVRLMYGAGLFKVRSADGRDALDAAPYDEIVSLRDGSGTQDIDRGWVWLTVRSPDGSGGEDVDGAGRLTKVSVLEP